METDEERIKAMVEEADQLSKRGENKESLKQLDCAWEETESLSFSVRKDPLRGLICHYRGRVLQAIGRYELAVEELQEAARCRKDNLIDYAYTMFQLFICKTYGNLPISDEEVEETKMALLKAIADDTATIVDIGNMM